MSVCVSVCLSCQNFKNLQKSAYQTRIMESQYSHSMVGETFMGQQLHKFLKIYMP